MMTDSIKMSALSRHIKVGYAYNYFDDNIVKIPDIKVMEEHVKINWKNVPETKLTVFHQQPDHFKFYMLDINSHLKNSIEEKTAPDLKQLWFGDYMKTDTKTYGENGVAQVDVFLRVIKRTETLSNEFIDEKMSIYQLQCGGKATHFVEQVSYGAEFILSIQKKIDLFQETKEDVEDEIQSAAKIYFEQIFEPDSDNIELPLELNEVCCKVYSSLFKVPEAANKGIDYYSFQDAIKSIRDIIRCVHQEDPTNTWKAIEMTLSKIPKQLIARISTELVMDYKTKNIIKMNSIQRQSNKLSRHSSLNNVPPLRKVLGQFQEVFESLWKKIESIYVFNDSSDRISKENEAVSELLTEIEEWLNRTSQQIATFSCLLKDIKLDMLTLGELKSRVPSREETCAKVFVLKINWVPDQLMEKIKKIVGRAEEQHTPVFPEFTINDHTAQSIRQNLLKFANEANSNPSMEPKSCMGYYIGLVPGTNKELVDGEIKMIEFRASILQEEKNILTSSITLDRQLRSESVGTDDNLRSSEELDNLESLMQNLTTNTKSNGNNVLLSSLSRSKGTNSLKGTQEPSTDEKLKNDFDREPNKSGNRESAENMFRENSNSTLVDKDNVSGSDTETLKSSSLVQKKQKVGENQRRTSAITIDKVNDSKKLNEQKKPKTFSYDKRFQQGKRNKSLENRRIAEVFVEDNNVSKLIQNEVPNVYLLNAEENSINTELRWFHIVNSEIKSSLHLPTHKFIILMGATGCGKSTLINGMINYILGVQWNDPFRFKVVREDESAPSRNQAHSQTSSVTAYTLEHQDGMTVPYSITIIDTPGYGDTRGVNRDKKITQDIHRFLSQTDTEINEIHAVCFVAASSDSRLTATQSYILDSVLSTFGKNVKDNIRLLVTFADNELPPVIEACKEAHFPLTSQSDDIIYSKFNSSVLYAFNQQQEEDFSFDKLFWDMGQENFQNFFKTLETMNGCDLMLTREVIGRRQKAERALKNVEREVDICLVKIENMEKFQRQIKMHGNKMEANKNHTFEVTELRPYLKSSINKLKVAYNCHKCKKTCEQPKLLKNLEKFADDLSIIPKIKCNSCSCSISDHEYQRSVYCQEEIKVERTLHDMKAQFEASSKKKLSTQELLVKCTEDLELAKVKVLSLLSQLEENTRSLDSTALLSTALSPADYLSLMRSRVAEEQKPGYMTRLETLSELQKCLDERK